MATFCSMRTPTTAVLRSLLIRPTTIIVDGHAIECQMTRVDADANKSGEYFDVGAKITCEYTVVLRTAVDDAKRREIEASIERTRELSFGERTRAISFEDEA